MKNITKIGILFVMFTLALSACANQPAATPAPAEQTVAGPLGVVAEGKLEPVHAANLFFQARGTVAEINVEIGDSVEQGDVLARLSNFEVAQAQLTAANLELLQAQQAYDQLVRTAGLDRADAWTAFMNAQIARAEAEREWEALNLDNITDRMEDAGTAVKDRAEDLQDAQEEFDKYKDLSEDNTRRSTAEDDLERAQEDYNEAVREAEEITRERDTVRAALDAALGAEAEAKYQFEQSADGANKETLALLSARLENAKAQVAAAEESLNNYQIVAPFDGVVAEVAVRVGEQVGPEARAVSVADTSGWIIETTDVTEIEVVSLKVGQQVTFTPDALPEVTLTGVVSEISQAAYIQGGDVLYTVRIQVEETEPHLKWGMTVEVTFEPLE